MEFRSGVFVYFGSDQVIFRTWSGELVAMAGWVLDAAPLYFALRRLKNTRMRGAARKKLGGLREKEVAGVRGWGGGMGRRG
jgi:hypothetical protein